jgi:1,4-alpha-glucan branching enzyme
LKELQEAGFTAVYGDYSHKLHQADELKGYLDYIYNISGDEFPEGSRWFHFPDSHDFDRSPRKVLGDAAGDEGLALLANQSRWLLTAMLPGIPLVFNGFEKIEWQPINIWSYGAINWEKQADLREYIEKINSIRQRLKPIQKGDYQFLETNQGLHSKTQLFSFMRTYDNNMVVVVVNMDVKHQAGPAVIYLPDKFNTRYRLKDWMTGAEYERTGKELTVILPPGGGHVFEVIFD